MPKVDVYNINGQKVGDMDLSDDIFAVKVNKVAMHSAVVNALANARQGHNPPRPDQRFAAEVKNPGDKKVQAVPAMAVSVPHSG
jgi:ribosomal protein L4